MAALRPCRPSGLVVVGAPRPSIGIRSQQVHFLGDRQSSTSSLLNLTTSSGISRSWTTMMVVHDQLHHRYQIARAYNGLSDWSAMFPDRDKDKPMTEEEMNKIREKIRKRHELDKVSLTHRSSVDSSWIWPANMPFYEDREKIDEYLKKMPYRNTTDIFHIRATELSIRLCCIAGRGVKMASNIMNCAVLTLDEQDEISLDTTKQTLAIYVSIFVKLADDACHRKFHVESMFSLLGAFKGVAAVGHILLQEALERVEHAESISSKYNFTHDWDEFEQELKKLEDKFRDVSNSPQSYEILRSTMDGAMILTQFFVAKMTWGREMVRGKLPDYEPRRDKDDLPDEDSNASATGSK